MLSVESGGGLCLYRVALLTGAVAAAPSKEGDQVYHEDSEDNEAASDAANGSVIGDAHFTLILLHLRGFILVLRGRQINY